MKLFEIDLNKKVSLVKRKEYLTQKNLRKSKQYVFWLNSIIRGINKINNYELGNDWKIEFLDQPKLIIYVSASKFLYPEQIYLAQIGRFMIKCKGKVNNEIALKFGQYLKNIVDKHQR